MKARPTISLLLICLAASSFAGTKIYRTVDENGTVTFTDKPPAGEQVEAAPLDVKPANVYAPASRSRDAAGRDLWIVDGAEGSENSDDAGEQVFTYQSLEITSPSADEAVRSNNGNLSVTVAIRPHLDGAHRLQLSLDGATAATSSGTSFALKNVSRGTHVASVSVVDDNGAVLITSGSVEFHVLRVSR